MRKLAPAQVSYWDDFFISYYVCIMTGSFHILLFEGTLHVDKIHVRFKIVNITHALPIQVYLQTCFTLKCVVVLRLHDTVVAFCTDMKLLPWYNNPGELMLRWLVPALHFVVVLCKQMWSHKRELEWTHFGVVKQPSSITSGEFSSVYLPKPLHFINFIYYLVNVLSN